MENNKCGSSKFKISILSLSYTRFLLTAWAIYTKFRYCVIGATNYDICYVLNEDGKGGHFENYESSNPKIGQNGNGQTLNGEAAEDNAKVPKEDQDSDNSSGGTFEIAKIIMDLNKGKIGPREAILACKSIRFFERNSSHFENFTDESKNEFKQFFGGFTNIKKWFEKLGKSMGLEKSFSLVEQEDAEAQAKLIEKIPNIKGGIVRNSHLYENINKYIQEYFCTIDEKYFSCHADGVWYEERNLIVFLMPHINDLPVSSKLIPFIYATFDNEQHMILILVNDENEMCGLIEVTFIYKLE